MAPEKKSQTEALVQDISFRLGITFTDEQRKDLCDLVRGYRFQQVSAALLRVKELVRQSGNADLSQHIFSNLDP
jgi:hypothetical protein